MATRFDHVGLLVLAYIVGSIPTGVILGQLRGVDVRAIGSGNIGATNVTRALGSRFGIYTLIGDAFKGLIPVLLARFWMDLSWPWVSAVALLCVLGHCFSIFLDFNGGKGVATSAGVFLGISPAAVLGSSLVWGVVFLVTRVSSFGSFASIPALLLLLVFLPEYSVLGFRFENPRMYIPVAIGIAAVILIRHKANLRRMLQGAEHRFQRRAE